MPHIASGQIAPDQHHSSARGNTKQYSPGTEFCLAEIKNKVLSARYVATGQAVEFEQRGERLFLRALPCPLPDPIATSIALEVEGPPEPIRIQETFWIPD